MAVPRSQHKRPVFVGINHGRTFFADPSQADLEHAKRLISSLNKRETIGLELTPSQLEDVDSLQNNPFGSLARFALSKGIKVKPLDDHILAGIHNHVFYMLICQAPRALGGNKASRRAVNRLHRLGNVLT